MTIRSSIPTTLASLAVWVGLVSACSPERPPEAQQAPARSIPVDTLTHAAWSRRAVIYEVNVRQYTPEGTLRAIEPHLARLKSLGVDVIWLMPVQPIGRKNRKGVMGSYYSISDYTAINPELGTMADFDSLVAAAHREGLKVLLDWVPNHTAFDHPWITQHRDWYVTRADGTVINARDNEGHDTDWTDVAELNYGNPALRQAMIDAMRWWLEHGHVDGFRCDVAGGVPLDFWMQARAELRKVRPDLFMLAEAEDPRLHAAFDMTYGWELHHLLNDVARGKRSAPALDAYFARQDSVFGRDAYRLYFTSNHDENSWNGSEFERMGANAQPAFVLAATVRGSMPLLYTGQEVSLRKRLRFFEKDTVDWHGPSLAPFYHALFDLKHRHQALANGAEGGDQTTVHTAAGDRVYVFARARGSDVVVVALNFGDAPVSAAYRDLRAPGAFTDWFSRAPVALPAAGTIDIPAHGYRVLVR
ncbi:MAG: alpha-amylase [Gemmatimonadetes bacterium]|nr:MAG: alpha-amylase [Gemmatimonadota bacterium]